MFSLLLIIPFERQEKAIFFWISWASAQMSSNLILFEFVTFAVLLALLIQKQEEMGCKLQLKGFGEKE